MLTNIKSELINNRLRSSGKTLLPKSRKAKCDIVKKHAEQLPAGGPKDKLLAFVEAQETRTADFRRTKMDVDNAADRVIGNVDTAADRVIEKLSEKIKDCKVTHINLKFNLSGYDRCVECAAVDTDKPEAIKLWLAEEFKLNPNHITLFINNTKAPYNFVDIKFDKTWKDNAVDNYDVDIYGYAGNAFECAIQATMNGDRDFGFDLLSPFAVQKLMLHAPLKDLKALKDVFENEQFTMLRVYPDDSDSSLREWVTRYVVLQADVNLEQSASKDRIHKEMAENSHYAKFGGNPI